MNNEHNMLEVLERISPPRFLMKQCAVTIVVLIIVPILVGLMAHRPTRAKPC